MVLRLEEHLASLHDRMRYEPASRRIRCFVDGLEVCDMTGAAVV